MKGHHAELPSQKISAVGNEPCERIRESESVLKTVYHLSPSDVEPISRTTIWLSEGACRKGKDSQITVIGQHIECRTRRSLLVMCWDLKWVRGLVVCSDVTSLSDGTERDDEHKDMLAAIILVR